MKKTTIYIVIALLCLNFWARAQDNKAVDVTLKGIQIGQKVPDITITNLHNYKDANGKPSTTAKLSDFKGKLLILDFWATWCSPCVAMIPKMDSLKKEFGDKIQFLSVTYQTEKEVLPFLEKFEKQQGKHYNLPVVTSSKQLHQLFPHTTLPHYIWVDGSGLVKAVTGYEEVNTENISKVFANAVELERKKDMNVVYNKEIPLLINGNGGNGSNLIYHSILTGYIDGLGSMQRIRSAEKSTKIIRAINYPLLNLMQLAYGNGQYNWKKNRTDVEVSSPEKISSGLKGRAVEEWLKAGNGYSYELILPNNSKKNLWEEMKSDLAELFDVYEINIEKRKKTCLAIVKTTDENLFNKHHTDYLYKATADELLIENTFFSVLTWNLENVYLKGYPNPIINDTGYDGKIGINLQGDLKSLAGLDISLAKYGLKLVEKELFIPVLVIKDKHVNTGVAETAGKKTFTN